MRQDPLSQMAAQVQIPLNDIFQDQNPKAPLTLPTPQAILPFNLSLASPSIGEFQNELNLGMTQQNRQPNIRN